MRLIIRITRTTISFTAPNTVIEGQTDFEQYSMKTGISVAANMRQALADCRLLQVHTSPTQNGQTMPSQYHPVFSQVRVYVDTPKILIPAEEFDADAATLIYHHVNNTFENDDVDTVQIPAANVVAAFAVGKDLRFVLTERFLHVEFLHLLGPVITEFSRFASGGFQEKMFCYFHDRRVDIFSFRKGRLRISTSFEISTTEDSAYYILNTWQQLGMRKTDILCLSGNITGHEALLNMLKQFVRNIKHVNI